MKNTSTMTWSNFRNGSFGINLSNQYVQAPEHENTMLLGLHSIMKAILVLFLLVLSTLSVSAQKQTVLDAFTKHGIDAGILNSDNLKQPDDYAYDLKQTTITAGKQTTIIAKFDPSSPKEQQWTVVSVDGKAPSKSDISSFRKNQNKPAGSNQTDPASYRIEKESPDDLVISYKQDPASVTKDAAFMKDCRSYMTISLKTKKLEQVQAVNEKPVKINILNAEKLDLVLKYASSDQPGRYFPENQELNIAAKFMGQAVNIQTITEYSNYSKK